MNPRRSSRARATQPPSTAMQHTNSSSSMNSLNRPERSTRANNKSTPSSRSATNRSQSIDDPDAGSRGELPHTRQRQRGREDTETNNNPPLTGDEYDEDDGDEEEITRCICGHQDYPGLPPTSREIAGRSSLKTGVKDELALNASAPGSDILSEDAGSLFIQCDSCKVWQHGGCVGIMDEASSPDEYFCEKCRKDLHKIIVGPHGQKSSHYLPVAGSTSPPPSISSRDSSNSSKDKRSRNAVTPNTKRRSTMNSRDAAYDEEEQLRRAIEESKGDNTKSGTDEIGSRRGKRSRSGSEANKRATKRQRTSSLSPPHSKPSRPNSQPVSDDEGKSKPNVNGNHKKTRATAARNQREKDTETTEHEPEKETAPEPTTRRKGRSERRKRDAESEPLEAASPVKAGSSAPAVQSVPETPNIPPQTTAPKPATRKTGRPPARRGRLGRNQYTRDRDSVNGNNLDGNQSNLRSPRRGQSRDGGDSPTSGRVNGNYANGGGESGRPSKPRYMNPNRTTMNDMRRRVAAILEFISRMQVEMAVSGEQDTPPSGANAGSGSRSGAGSRTLEMAATLAKVNAEVQSLTVNGDVNGSSSDNSTQENNSLKEKDFRDMSSVEMMDVLTRNLLKWQQEFGKYGDK